MSKTISRRCPYCEHEHAEVLVAEERMLGLGGAFDYSRCLGCGAMELMNLPHNFSMYYPDNYYSLHHVTPHPPPRGWKAPLQKLRNRATVFGTRGIGGALALLGKPTRAVEISTWLRHSPVQSFRARVLDVGCGSGHRLCRMHTVGFSDLTGVDPFATEREIRPGLRILKQQLSETNDGPYDLIMLHHSLEHMPNHAQVMSDIRRLLSPTGACLIRIPMAGNRLIDRYGSRWVEWDAPRHLVLHTENSIRELVTKSGFDVLRVDWDSDRFGYWASELYERGLTLVDPNTGQHRDPTAYFTTAELSQFDTLAKEDNQLGQASRAALWIAKAPSK